MYYGKNSHRYVVLNDGNFILELWAETDNDAIRMFQKMDI